MVLAFLNHVSHGKQILSKLQSSKQKIFQLYSVRLASSGGLRIPGVSRLNVRKNLVANLKYIETYLSIYIEHLNISLFTQNHSHFQFKLRLFLGVFRKF